jgi:hypothetical protein
MKEEKYERRDCGLGCSMVGGAIHGSGTPTGGEIEQVLNSFFTHYDKSKWKLSLRRDILVV